MARGGNRVGRYCRPSIADVRSREYRRRDRLSAPNSRGCATALLAWFVFHENFDRRIAVGMTCLVMGAAILSWSGQPSLSALVGPLTILGACLAWGLDNNLTRKMSLADPLQIVEVKGLIAGPVNLALGLWAGGTLPPLSPLIIAGIVGFLGYGLSLALFIRTASSWNRSNRSLLLYGTFSRSHCHCHCCNSLSARTADAAALVGRIIDGPRSLAAPHGRS